MAFNQTLVKQGQNIFYKAPDTGIMRRITDPTGVDIANLSDIGMVGGTTSGNVSLAEAQKMYGGYEAEIVARNQPQTFEQTFGSVAAKAAGQAFNPANIGSGFRPRGANEPLYEYLNAKKATEIGQTGASAVGELISPAIGRAAADKLSNEQALVQLQQEQKYLATYGTAIPTPAQLSAGPKFNETGTALSGKTMDNVPTGNFQTAPPLAVVPDTTKITLGPEEAKAQAASEAALVASNALAGKTEYQLAQEQAAGLPSLEANLRDYNSQMAALDAEAASIRPALEEFAVGKGLTTQILGRQDQALLNQNTIKKLNLSVSINAMQGKIATARDQSARAVVAKYGPLEEKLAIAKNNLDIIIHSPKYDAETKAKAAELKKNIEAQETVIKEQKAVQKDINDWKIKAAATGKLTAEDSAKFDTLKTEAEAAQLAAPYVGSSKTSADITEYEYAKKQGFTGTFLQWIDRKSNKTTPTKMTDSFKQWYYKTFKEPAKESDPNVQAEWQRWKETGAGAKATSINWGEVNPTTGKTPEQGYLDMGISQEMIDMAKSAGLLPKDLL